MAAVTDKLLLLPKAGPDSVVVKFRRPRRATTEREIERGFLSGLEIGS